METGLNLIAARRMRWALIALMALTLLGAALAWRWTQNLAAQDLEQWRVRMGLTVEAGAQSVNQWLDEQTGLAKRLAESPAVEAYTLGVLRPVDPAISAGQRGYLESLLSGTLAKAGVSLPPSVKADVERPESPGIAIVRPDGGLIARAGGPLPPPGALLGQPDLALDGAASLNGEPALRIAVPIRMPQSSASSAPVAYLYFVRRLDGLAASLSGGAETPGARLYVVRRDSGGGGRGAAAIAPAQGATATDKAALAALAGAQFEETVDAMGAPAMLAARPVPRAGWAVAHTIPSNAIFGPALTRARILFAAMIASLVAAGALVLLAWRHGAALRAVQAAADEAKLRAFLAEVADRQRAAIGVADADGKLSFANAALRRWAGREDLAGAPLAAVLNEAAAPVEDALKQSRASRGEALVDAPEPRAVANGAVRLQVEAAPLADGEHLFVAHDMSAFLSERERREGNLDALVRALANLIDARDPDAAGHSDRVSLAAKGMANALALPEAEAAALALAGRLMNLGKILAPRALLTKAAPLNEAEKETVRQAMSQSAAVLEHVPFDGPVAQLIADAFSAQPSQGGRILKAANAYIGMVSPRAHRQPLDPGAALTALRQDPSLAAEVSALEHFLRNQGGLAALV